MNTNSKNSRVFSFEEMRKNSPEIDEQLQKLEEWLQKVSLKKENGKFICESGNSRIEINSYFELQFAPILKICEYDWNGDCKWVDSVLSAIPVKRRSRHPGRDSVRLRGGLEDLYMKLPSYKRYRSLYLQFAE